MSFDKSNNLNFLRFIFSLSILLYHLNILQGGFLMVCAFFTISGFLFYKSIDKENFSLKQYYINKLKRLYLPLIVVVFISVACVLLFTNTNWVNLKPEVTSILFSFNNFWQLQVNGDYFARHIASPFMHLWYISILIQIELILPLLLPLYIKKIKEKTKLKITIVSIFTNISIIIFLYFFYNTDLMNLYYNTFSRIFSFFLGILMAVICGNKQYKINIFFKVISYIALLLMILLVNSTNIYLPYYMLLTSFITMLLLVDEKQISYNIIDFISGISYEVYLVQYPIIFVFQNINVHFTLKIFIIIIITFICSYLVNIALKIKKMKFISFKTLNLITCLSFCLFGFYQYITSKDHTLELNHLKQELAKNNEFIKEKQKNLAKNAKQKNNELNNNIEIIDEKLNNLDVFIKNLNVIAIGDSVLLGASQELYNTFPNGYFDGEVSRSGYVLDDILANLNHDNLIGDDIFVHLGTNGDFPSSLKEEVMNTYPNSHFYWLSVTNDDDVKVNEKLKKLLENKENASFIDWEDYSKKHGDYFYADKIHLTPNGRKAYSDLIYQTLYSHYQNKLTSLKQEIMTNYQNEIANTLTFIGDDTLNSAYSGLSELFNDANYISKDFVDIDAIINELNELKSQEILTLKIVLFFNANNRFNQNEIEKIINNFPDNEFYVITYRNEKYKNIKTIEFNEKNEKYYNIDGSLNKDGSLKLAHIIKDNID